MRSPPPPSPSPSDNAADVLVVRDPTASSSSESLFTDPLTPLGFAAELNQCYYSDENLSDGGCGGGNGIGDNTFRGSSFTIISSNNAQQPPVSSLAGRLAQLSVTEVIVFDSTMMESPMAAAISPAGSMERMQNGNATDAPLFTVSRVKKVELADLTVVTKGLTDQSGR